MNICNNGCERKFMLHSAIFATKEKPPTEILYNNWRCNGGEIRQVIMGWVEPETYCTKPTEIRSLYTEHCTLGYLANQTNFTRNRVYHITFPLPVGEI